MKCTHCGIDNPRNAKKCVKCGKPLPQQKNLNTIGANLEIEKMDEDIEQEEEQEELDDYEPNT